MGCFSTLWHKDTFSWLLSAIVFLLLFFRYLEQSALCVLMCRSHSTGALSKLSHTARHCRAHIPIVKPHCTTDTSQELATAGALAGSHAVNTWTIKWPKWSVITPNGWNQHFTAAHKVFAHKDGINSRKWCPHDSLICIRTIHRVVPWHEPSFCTITIYILMSCVALFRVGRRQLHCKPESCCSLTALNPQAAWHLPEVNWVHYLIAIPTSGFQFLFLHANSKQRRPRQIQV